ncbi:MarP family serine protease [Phycicoccus sonneratiae]|uniref:MarP family serine protease n=1 Tax=Phycicoccus sonneratiae TaxID=2807628 RepID=A0ABS2CHB0_9MICO|nr:MarP family serine protease [Phycicoccus sonneraticus]MBM6398833.1 MarP family serine protease [Phycicoccus sonneraticus]
MTGSVWVDLVLGVALVAYAWSGWRQGLVGAVLGLVGLVAGAFVGARVAPDLLEQHAGLDLATPAGTLVVIAVVLVLATVGQSVMLLLAGRLRTLIHVSGLGALDSLLGAVAVFVASTVVVWVVAGAARTSGPQPLRQAVAQSTVVRAVDSVMPPAAGRLVDEVTRALDRTGFPRVFEGLGPEPIRAVPAPDTALARDPDVAQALGSVVHVRAEAPRCGQTSVGSGWVAAPGLVVTNAHVVAGARSVRLSIEGTGPEVAARIVAFDPDRDVAVLAARSLGAPALDRGAQLEADDGAVLAGFPGDAGLWVGAARVRAVIEARGADIYGNAGATRETYSLRATVRQGASGGPVLDADGRVVGMVYATSLDDPQTGYAMTLDALSPVLRGATLGDRAVSSGACVRG